MALRDSEFENFASGGEVRGEETEARERIFGATHDGALVYGTSRRAVLSSH